MEMKYFLTFCLFTIFIAFELNTVEGKDYCGKYCNYASENHTATEEKLLSEMDSAEVTSDFLNFFHGLPHYNVYGKNIGNNWNPTDWEYYTALGYTAAPWALCFILIGFASSIAVCARCCTIYCKKQNTKYSRGALCCSKLCAFFIGLVIIVPIVMALVANLTMHDAVVDSVNQYTTEQQRIYNTLNSVESLLNSMNNSQATAISREFSSFTNASDEWTQVQYYIDEYALYAENYRNIAVCCFGGLAILLLIAFSLSCLCNFKCCTFCFTSILLLFVPWLFLFSAIHVPGAVFVADMCPQVDEYIVNQTHTSNATYYFEYYTQCQDKSMNPLSHVNETVSSYLALAEYELQNAINKGDPNKTIQALQQIVYDLSTMEGYITTLSNCNSSSEAWNEIKLNICTEFLDGIGYMMVFNCVSAFLIWILVAIGYQLVKIYRSNSVNTTVRNSKKYYSLEAQPPIQPAARKPTYNTFAKERAEPVEEIIVLIQPNPVPAYVNDSYMPQPQSVAINRNPFDNYEVYNSKDEDNMTYPLLYPNVNADPTAPPSE